jgi:Tol biopolymer transport system component
MKHPLRNAATVVVLAGSLAVGIGLNAKSSAPRFASPNDKFQVAAEKQIREIPFGSAISPDGSSVLIVKSCGLTVRPLESPTEKQLLPPGSLPNTQFATWAAWSADGASVYYLQSTDQAFIFDLWRLDTLTLKKKLLIKNAAPISMPKPTPSPDGKSIAFYRGKTLMLARADGQDERVLLEPGHLDGEQRVLVWSPDSSQMILVTASPVPGGLQKLVLLTISSGQIKPLTQWRGAIISVVWPSWGSGLFLSGGGQSLTWPGFTHDVWHIWHLSLPTLEGEELTQVTSAPANYFKIVGAAANGDTLVVERFPPPPDGWNMLLSVLSRRLGLGVNEPSNFQPTVLLTLKR